jgi:hypothetical protein
MTRGALTLVPLFSAPTDLPRYRTGPVAEELGVLHVGELSEGAVVPELVVVNTGDLPILLVEGETFLGNKQNRTVNVSVLCPPGELAVPVSCVEQGRWDAGRVAHRSSRHAPLALRERKTRAVVGSVRSGGDRMSAQAEVWDHISDLGARMDVTSLTMALEDIQDARAADVSELVAGLRPEPDQTGVAVVTDGCVRMIELFDRADTLADYWDGLVAGYALEASLTSKVDDEATPDVQSFLAHLAAAAATDTDAVGLGREVHLESDGVHGVALTWEGRPVHVCAFAVSDHSSAPRSELSRRRRIQRSWPSATDRRNHVQ